MQKDIQEIKVSLEDIKNLLNKLDRTKADIWVERAVSGFVVLLVMGALYLIFDHVGIPR
jgi:hypothetical protein